MLELYWSLIALNVFNIIDAAGTMYTMNHYDGWEANPAMAYLLSLGPFTFFTVKIFILFITTILLGKFGGNYTYKPLKWGIRFYLVFYGFLAVYYTTIITVTEFFI